MTPLFPSKDQVLKMHQELVKLFGGSQGLRDHGLVDSALAQPQAGFGDEYAHKDLYGMAGAYLFHLVQNHPFHDGNKRIGLAVSAVFLELNGLEVTASNEEFETIIMETAQGQKKKPEIAAFFRAKTAAMK